MRMLPRRADLTTIDHSQPKFMLMRRFALFFRAVLLIPALIASWSMAQAAEPKVDFNRDVRTILSNNCLTCHGPDDAERQGGLRLDIRAGAVAAGDSGELAVVPNQPEQSELIRRITTEDVDQRMPPADSGRKLSPAEVKVLSRWVSEGANYARHWSYLKPERPAVPPQSDPRWAQNPIDAFVMERLQREGLTPLGEADRHTLVRRLSLDLTGLPPTLAEVEQFVADTDPAAYDNLVDRLLEKKSFGEHWARQWLDLARYADSAGYADDPPRTIWAYRDYVIRSLNDNKPFDQFTIEQLAGDLLPDPTDEQLIATAFHRNTLTNNEGGTSDEEFRNVAVVDRVNTTMAVWMGTTISCCQCHNHKYDPITQEEYFRLFAIFNNSADADRRDESPLHQVWTPDLLHRKAALERKIAELESTTAEPSPEMVAALAAWEAGLPRRPVWQAVKPDSMTRQSTLPAIIGDDGSVTVTEAATTDVYTVDIPITSSGTLTALRLEALPADGLAGKGPGHAGGNFVVTRVLAEVRPATEARRSGRFVRIENLGEQQILSLAEVQVFRDGENIARQGVASQSSTGFNGPAALAIDGNTDGNYQVGSTTHTEIENDPWWELDLKAGGPIERIVLWNRTDNNLHERLRGFRITLLDEERQEVWHEAVAEPPHPSSQFSPHGSVGLEFTAAYADFSQPGFEADQAIQGKDAKAGGWAIAPQFGTAHTLDLVTGVPVKLPVGSHLSVTIEQLSSHARHLLGHFRLATTGDASVADFAEFPAAVLAALNTESSQRTDQQRTTLMQHFLRITRREELAEAKKKLAELKPETTVPVMAELPAAKARQTHIQVRGNYLVKGEEVTAGLPSAFHPISGPEAPDRLALARWLVDPENPLTARVIANRYWESLFGVGIVRTSEEFGMQGELPSHPELLDWLATELMASGWDTKHLLRTMVRSATYRQSSFVSDATFERDPENRWLARGPRFRMSAEMVRDQALFVAGLLSDKMHGPPVRPPQPNIGLNAAFGGGIDWKTSAGEDRHRRGLYTTWRRSNPYPSMATFDAPNREVCTIRRDRTNTPLQALVTLNDPVYIEAAQALARQMDAAGETPATAIEHGFRRCLARQPSDQELAALTRLFETTYARLANTPDQAMQLATTPLGPAPADADIVTLAALTVVGNVLLNTDEMIMKR